MRKYAVAALLGCLASALSFAQTEAPLTAARKALGLPESRADYKQLAAGDATTQYIFMVRSDAAGTRVYLTNSKQQYRGAANQNVKEPIRMMPSGDPKAAAEFREILKIWAHVAQSL